MKAKNETSPVYEVTPIQASVFNAAHEDGIIFAAMNILLARMSRDPVTLSNPKDTKKFLQLKLAQLEHEVFAVIFLDAQHRVITYEEMFRGTLTQTSVYPREVVKAALKHNAAALFFAHNHPSGVDEPSRSDRLLTDALKQALTLVDVRVLDHFIIAGQDCMSFAERGLI